MTVLEALEQVLYEMGVTAEQNSSANKPGPFRPGKVKLSTFNSHKTDLRVVVERLQQVKGDANQPLIVLPSDSCTCGEAYGTRISGAKCSYCTGGSKLGRTLEKW